MSTMDKIDELRRIRDAYGIQDSTVTKYIVEHFPEEVWTEGGGDVLYYVHLQLHSFLYSGHCPYSGDTHNINYHLLSTHPPEHFQQYIL